MSPLFWIIISTVTISLISWIGLLILFLREDLLKKIILVLVAFSAGSLIGGAFLHLLPEAIEEMGVESNVFLLAIFGFLIFFLLEQFISWHHCHKTPCEHKKPVTYLILIADAVHNFIDGLVIGAAFMVDIEIGLITVLVIAFHEIPQELGDFGILIHGGWKKIRALWFNFFSASTIIIGGLAAYFISATIDIVFLLPIAAGSFIYISAADLLPEIKHHENIWKNILHFMAFIVGILLIYGLGFVKLFH